ncbi:unnamed protein product, partial [Amoebophrya sp. A25]
TTAGSGTSATTNSRENAVHVPAAPQSAAGTRTAPTSLAHARGNTSSSNVGHRPTSTGQPPTLPTWQGFPTTDERWNPLVGGEGKASGAWPISADAMRFRRLGGTAVLLLEDIYERDGSARAVEVSTGRVLPKGVYVCTVASQWLGGLVGKVTYQLQRVGPVSRIVTP